MMTILSVLESLKDGLEAYFNALDYHWKTQSGLSGYNEGKPYFYLLNCPKTERTDDNFPIRMPSVTVVVTDAAMQGGDTVTLSLVLHCCVANSATLDREIVQKSDGGYSYLETDGYTDAGIEQSLFRDCLLLGEEVMRGLAGIDGTGRRVSELRLVPPSSDMEDFPHCQCQVVCKVNMLSQPKPIPPAQPDYNDLL